MKQLSQTDVTKWSQIWEYCTTDSVSEEKGEQRSEHLLTWIVRGKRHYLAVYI